MDVPEAWTKATGAGVTVGIVDTGLLATHPDLVNQLATNAGETGTDALGRDKRSNGVDDDGNGYRDDWHGWDFVSEYPSIGVSEGDSTAGPDNDPQDNHGHGTHVAGTVAAQRDNNEGIAGVAPGAKIMPLRALGANGSGTSIAIAEAFDYAGKMGLRVVNASLGGPGLDQTQLAAIQAHPNTLYVIAAGNANVNNDVTPYGPCALPAANILCVGASDVNDRRASFSNYGAHERRRVRARHGDPVDLPVARVRVPAGHVDGQPERGRRRGARAVGRARRQRARRQERDHGLHRGQARPGRQVGHRRAGQRRPGGRRRARRRAGERHAARDHRDAAPGRRAGRVVGHLEPGRDLVRLRLAAVVRRRLDLDGDRRRDRARPTRPGASDIGAQLRVTVTATNPYGVASATSAAVGPVASGAPVNTSPPVISGTPRRGQVLTVSAAWNPAGTSYAYQWQRSTDGVTWTTIGANASSYTLTTRRARGARARDRHGDQRLRAGLGDQRPDRAGRLGSARQHRRRRPSPARRSGASR